MLLVKLKNENGQAMVEFVIVAFALVILFHAMQFMTDAYLIKNKTIVSSRYATWMLASNSKLTVSEVEEKVKQYYFPAERDYVSVEKWEEERGFVGGLVTGSLGFVNKLFTGRQHDPLAASYVVRYDRSLNLPAALPDTFPDKLQISAFHEVDGNTWNHENSDVHDLFDVIINAGSDVVDYFTGL